MAHTINSHQLQDLKIFDTENKPLRLCHPHRKDLEDYIAPEINKLVQSSFFQDKFRTLFSSDATGAHCNIRLTEKSLIVQLMHEDESGRHLKPEGKALMIDLNPTTGEEGEDVIKINKTILDRADALFQKCQNECLRSHRSDPAPSLGDRATHLKSASEDELIAELAARKRPSHPEPIDDPSSAPRGTESLCPDHLHRHTRTARENPADPLRKARELQFNLRLQAEHLRQQPSVTIEQLASLYEQICRLEQQIQHLLGTPLMTTTETTPAPILERIEVALSRIKEGLRQLEEGPTIVPVATTPSSDKIDELEQQRTQLENRLADVTRHIDSLEKRNVELSSQVTSLITPPSSNLPLLTDEQFQMLTSLAQQLGDPSVRDSENFPFATDTQFLSLPEKVRDSVYFQTYISSNPTSFGEDWQSGEHCFLNSQEGLCATNGLRALAITRCQLQSLANEFATLGNGQIASNALIDRFNQLSKEDQEGILRQQQFLRRSSHQPIDVTRASFLGCNNTPATNQERAAAISRYLQVQISDRYSRTICELTNELKLLTEALNETDAAHTKASEKLHTEMTQLREQNRLDLANAMSNVTSLENNLASAQSDLAQLKQDVSYRDLQIAALQGQVDEATKKQSLAQEQISQLTRTDSDKDHQAAQLGIELEQVKQQKSVALALIKGLMHENTAENSRIRALQERLPQLEKALKNAQIELAEKEQIYLAAMAKQRANISNITEEHKRLKSDKEALQKRYEQLDNESNLNQDQLKLQIAKLKESVRLLNGQYRETKYAFQETQKKLEAGEGTCIEMKQRFLKIQAALEEESAQHDKEKQAWEKELAHLRDALETVKEKGRLTDVENKKLRDDVESAFQERDEEAKNKLQFKTEMTELEETIRRLETKIEDKDLTLQETRKKLEITKSEYDTERKQLADELHKSLNSIVELGTEKVNLTRALEKQKSDFQAKIVELENQSEEALSPPEGKRWEIFQLVLELQKYEEELQSKLDEATKNKENLITEQKELEFEANQREQVGEENSQLMDHLTYIYQLISEKNLEIDKLRQTLSYVKTKLNIAIQDNQIRIIAQTYQRSHPEKPIPYPTEGEYTNIRLEKDYLQLNLQKVELENQLTQTQREMTEYIQRFEETQKKLSSELQKYKNEAEQRSFDTERYQLLINEFDTKRYIDAKSKTAKQLETIVEEDISTENTELEKTIQNLMTEIANKDVMLEETRSKVEISKVALKKEEEKLRSELQKYKNEAEQQFEIVEDITTENTDLEKTIQNLKKTIQNLMTEIENKDLAIQKQLTEQDADMSRITKLTLDLSNQQAKIYDLEQLQSNLLQYLDTIEPDNNWQVKVKLDVAQQNGDHPNLQTMQLGGQLEQVGEENSNYLRELQN